MKNAPSVAINSPELAAHPIAKANRNAGRPERHAGESVAKYRKRTGWTGDVPFAGMSAEGIAIHTAGHRSKGDGLTFTADDMGRAVFQSDIAPHRASVAKCADVCSYVTRVLFGRNLLIGRGPIRVDLENGHHLVVAMRENGEAEPARTLSKEHARALRWAVRQACSAEALRDAINDDRGAQHRKNAKRARAALKELTS